MTIAYSPIREEVIFCSWLFHIFLEFSPRNLGEDFHPNWWYNIFQMVWGTNHQLIGWCWSKFLVQIRPEEPAFAFRQPCKLKKWLTLYKDHWSEPVWYSVRGVLGSSKNSYHWIERSGIFRVSKSLVNVFFLSFYSRNGFLENRSE